MRYSIKRAKTFERRFCSQFASHMNKKIVAQSELLCSLSALCLFIYMFVQSQKVQLLIFVELNSIQIISQII